MTVAFDPDAMLAAIGEIAETQERNPPRLAFRETFGGMVAIVRVIEGTSGADVIAMGEDECDCLCKLARKIAAQIRERAKS